MATICIRNGVAYVNVTVSIKQTERDRALKEKINLSATLAQAMNTAPIKKLGH